MGQTLTHGVYLPDEGERNCYSGLAANWQILDTSVGTIAAHTAALAGKAPLVHTHTKADITDFPAYGNAAGTICEGNDSRLSDARTPVAHTHTKNDVTDLLNSDFIPSANNSYNLGSASKQWLNTYSKGYYYNGVAWGLDKANEWTNNNTYQGNIYHKSGNSALVKGTNPSSVTYYGSFRNITYDGTEINLFRGYIGTTGDNCYRWSVEPWVSGSNGRFQMRVSSDGSVRVFEVDGTEVSPYTNNATDLGTSTKRWKTLNGINPGALGMPRVATTFEDLTGYVLDGVTENQFPISGLTAFDGWLQCRVKHTLGVASFLRMETSYRVWTASDKDCIEEYVLWIPVRAGMSFNKVVCKADDLEIRFHPCMGNV